MHIETGNQGQIDDLERAVGAEDDRGAAAERIAEHLGAEHWNALAIAKPDRELDARFDGGTGPLDGAKDAGGKRNSQAR